MATWENDTWKPLVELADHHPEAGIHLQSKENVDILDWFYYCNFELTKWNKESRCYSRTKDLATPIGKTFGHFVSTDPWFKNTVRDVRYCTSFPLVVLINTGTKQPANKASVPSPTNLRAPARNRRRLRIHLPLHKHRHLPPLPRISMSLSWRNSPAKNTQSHFPSPVLPPFGPKSRRSNKLYWAFSFQAWGSGR